MYFCGQKNIEVIHGEIIGYYPYIKMQQILRECPELKC